MPRDPFKELQAGIDESFDARFAGAKPKQDLLSTFATSAAPSSAPQAAPQEDLLGAWAGAATPKTERKGTITIRPWKARETEGEISGVDERPGQIAARWVAENQGDSIGEKAARFGAGVLRGVGDVADTLAQAIGVAGKGGVNVLTKAGIVSPETAKAVQDWHAGINDRIASDNALFQKAGDTGLAGAGQIVGQIAGSAPFLGIAGRAAMVPVNALTRAAPGAAQILSNPGNALRVGQLATSGAGIGAGTAGLTSAASNEPLADQIKSGGVAGAILGPLGAGAAKLGSKLVGGAVDAETAALAKTARDKFGIPVGAGQISENPTVRFLDSIMQRLPFTGMAARTAEQQTALNQAVAREMGTSANKITPSVVKNALKQAGRDYDDINSRIGRLDLDHSFVSGLKNIKMNASYNLEPAIAKRIDAHIDNVLSKVEVGNAGIGHFIDPANYQYLIRKDGPLGKALESGDSGIRQYAREIKDQLEKLVARNDPALAAEKNAVDYKYFVAKSIQQMADDAPTGNISPAKLLKAVDSSHADVGELGRIARRFMVEPPSSGTAERTMIMQHLPQLAIGATGLGGLAGATYFDPESWQRNALIGAGALAAGRAGGGLLRSNALASGMINSSLRGGGPSAAGMAAVRALPLLPAYGALRARQTNALVNSP